MLSWGSKEEESIGFSTDNFDEFLFKNREKQETERSAKKWPDNSTCHISISIDMKLALWHCKLVEEIYM